MILTDEQGRPIPKPERDDFHSTVAWLRAYHTWQDKVADIANRAFAEQFRKSLKDV